MCEFCTEHGEGKKWYLVMKNYSRELFAQKDREKFFENFLANFEEDAKEIAKLDAMRSKPLIFRFMRRMAIPKQKANHWGQVVPIEEVEQIIDMQSSIVRLPCVCRSLTTGRQSRYCFGIGVDPTGILGKYPDYAHSFEVLQREEAKKLLRSFDEQGLVHSVWTFKTPYIGGLCNCDQDCLAYRFTAKEKLFPVMFRAEYVASIDWDACTGCKKCISQCQYGAILYSHTHKKSNINVMQCYGCGVCRAACDQGAISLKPRSDFVKLPW
jgi:NAD-dependent dihydropyrimidine dehydrogenase PreA subunit